jgi:hypothetical protein
MRFLRKTNQNVMEHLEETSKLDKKKARMPQATNQDISSYFARPAKPLLTEPSDGAPLKSIHRTKRSMEAQLKRGRIRTRSKSPRNIVETVETSGKSYLSFTSRGNTPGNSSHVSWSASTESPHGALRYPLRSKTICTGQLNSLRAIQHNPSIAKAVLTGPTPSGVFRAQSSGSSQHADGSHSLVSKNSCPQSHGYQSVKHAEMGAVDNGRRSDIERSSADRQINTNLETIKPSIADESCSNNLESSELAVRTTLSNSPSFSRYHNRSNSVKRSSSLTRILDSCYVLTKEGEPKTCGSTRPKQVNSKQYDEIHPEYSLYGNLDEPLLVGRCEDGESLSADQSGMLLERRSKFVSAQIPLRTSDANKSKNILTSNGLLYSPFKNSGDVDSWTVNTQTSQNVMVLVAEDSGKPYYRAENGMIDQYGEEGPVSEWLQDFWRPNRL